jgi:hypothetical protein
MGEKGKKGDSTFPCILMTNYVIELINFVSSSEKMAEQIVPWAKCR